MRSLPHATTLLAVLMPCCLLQAQRTIHVPADVATIQSAINGSGSNDTILVSPGTYAENLDFLGKNITLQSTGGPQLTVLDGGGSAPTVQFVSGEARLAILQGFTIRNGAQGTSATSGGGVLIKGSSPTILNNIITGNRCNGIAASGAAPLIRGNTVSGTLAGDTACAYSGSALLLLTAAPLGSVIEVDSNIIENNPAPRLGVVHAENVSDLLFQRNEIRNNTYTASGSSPSAVVISSAGFATVVGNFVHDNFTTGNDGGGLFGSSSLNPQNQTYFGLPKFVLVNNTFVRNGVQPGYGSQIFLYNTSVRALVANNIAIGPNSTIDCYVTGMPKAPTVLQNNVASAYGSGCLLDPNAHNITTTDAKLSTAGVPQAGSPALDAGNNSALPQPSTDIAGSARAQSATAPVTIDAGSLEAPGSVTTPQSRLVIAPLRYEVVAGAVTDVSVALSSSDTTSLASTTATLYLDGNPVATVPLLANGSATFSQVTIPSGTHSLFATTLASGTLPAAQSIMVRVNGTAANATNAAIASPGSHVVMEVDPVAQLGSSLSTQFRCRLNDGTASGSMRQYDNGYLKGETLLTGAAVANATYIGDAGPHIYQCEYQDGTRSSSTVAAQVLAPAGTSTPPVLQLFSLPDPTEYGDPVTIGGSITPYTTALNGSVRITEGTQVVLDKAVDNTGVASVVRTDLAPGIHTFFGTITSTAGSTSSSFTQTVHFAPTRITLAASPTSGTTLTPIVLTITTTSTYTGTPITGSVSILDGATTLGVAGVVNGTVTLPANTLSGGTHLLTAAYSGSSIFAAATSNAVTVTLTVPPPPDFSITPAAPTLSLLAEHHGTVALTLTSLNNFNGTVSLACSNLPPVATCTFDKSSYSLSSTTPVSFVLETSAVPGYKSQLRSTSTTVLALLFGGGLLLRRRKRLALLGLLCLSGCSGKYPAYTPPGTYTIAITGTGVSGNTKITHAVPFTLTVTPE